MLLILILCLCPVSTFLHLPMSGLAGVCIIIPADVSSKRKNQSLLWPCDDKNKSVGVWVALVNTHFCFVCFFVCKVVVSLIHQAYESHNNFLLASCVKQKLRGIPQAPEESLSIGL